MAIPVHAEAVPRSHAPVLRVSDVARLLKLRDRLPGEWAGLLTRSAQALAN